MEPKTVANGAKVKMVFEEGGLTITTYGAALQSGSVGEVIRRNLDSGLTFPDRPVGRLDSRERRLMLRILLILLLCGMGFSAAASVRIKDIADLQGVA